MPSLVYAAVTYLQRRRLMLPSMWAMSLLDHSKAWSPSSSTCMWGQATREEVATIQSEGMRHAVTCGTNQLQEHKLQYHWQDHAAASCQHDMDVSVTQAHSSTMALKSCNGTCAWQSLLPQCSSPAAELPLSNFAA